MFVIYQEGDLFTSPHDHATTTDVLHPVEGQASRVSFSRMVCMRFNRWGTFASLSRRVTIWRSELLALAIGVW